MSPDSVRSKGRWLWVGLGRVELDDDDTLAWAARDDDIVFETDRFIVLNDSGQLRFYIHEDLVDGNLEGYVTG